MHSNCCVVIENSKSILKLILLVLSGQKEILDSDHTKNTLIAISTREKLKLEDAKLIFYLFSYCCSGFEKDASITDYLAMTGRTMQNKDPIRRSVKRLASLRIIYLDHNGKRQEQRLFKFCELKRGKIIYQVNSFFEGKLNIHGRGHREIEMKRFVFVDENHKSYRQNSIRLLVMLNLMYCLGDSDSIDQKILVSQRENVITLINEHFDHQVRNLNQWIFKAEKDY